MSIPITVIASTRPTEGILSSCLRDPGTALVVDRATAHQMGSELEMARGRFVASEPDVHYRTPGCLCCAVREDLIDSVIRASRRTTPPERLVVFVDPGVDDVLIAVGTILSSMDIGRRCSLDAVLVHVDAVELATRLSTGADLFDARFAAGLAVADRIVVDRRTDITSATWHAIRAELASRSGFARVIDGDDRVIDGGVLLDAWHGEPSARPTHPARTDQPSTIVLSVDQPLDQDAIEEWLNHLIAHYAGRLLRIQGALSVHGYDERTCCRGVRTFATSYSERAHVTRGSSESMLAVCGVGLDAAELASSFRATVAS